MSAAIGEEKKEEEEEEEIFLSCVHGVMKKYKNRD